MGGGSSARNVILTSHWGKEMNTCAAFVRKLIKVWYLLLWGGSFVCECCWASSSPGRLGLMWMLDCYCPPALVVCLWVCVNMGVLGQVTIIFHVPFSCCILMTAKYLARVVSMACIVWFLVCIYWCVIYFDALMDIYVFGVCCVMKVCIIGWHMN